MVSLRGCGARNCGLLAPTHRRQQPGISVHQKKLAVTLEAKPEAEQQDFGHSVHLSSLNQLFPRNVSETFQSIS